MGRGRMLEVDVREFVGEEFAMRGWYWPFLFIYLLTYRTRISSFRVFEE
jgi:hypothetical protein